MDRAAALGSGGGDDLGSGIGGAFAIVILLGSLLVGLISLPGWAALRGPIAVPPLPPRRRQALCLVGMVAGAVWIPALIGTVAIESRVLLVWVVLGLLIAALTIATIGSARPKSATAAFAMLLLITAAGLLQVVLSLTR